MRRRALWIVLIAIALNAPDVRAGGESHPSLVPWKVLEPGAPLGASPLTLFWIPSSRDQIRRSELLLSNELTLFSSRCVAMRIVRLDDRQTLEALGIEELPAVVLIDARGQVIERAEVPVSVADVESIVRDELGRRAEAAEAMLDEAADRAEDGDADGALAMYREVWNQRCVC